MERPELYTIKQATVMTGKTYSTIAGYVKNGHIEFFTYGGTTLLPRESVAKAGTIVTRRSRSSLEGHKSVTEASRVWDISPQRVKRYIRNGKLEHVETNGQYYIPDVVVNTWSKFKNPDPYKIEAFEMGAVTIEQAERNLKISMSSIRSLINEGHLRTVSGSNGRKYITIDSLKAHMRKGK